MNVYRILEGFVKILGLMVGGVNRLWFTYYLAYLRQMSGALGHHLGIGRAKDY